MKTKLPIFILCLFYLFISQARAEKIYLMNGAGYNNAEPQLINAIIANGHMVVVQTTNLTALPAGFTSYCADPVNGYDWLCLFGNIDYSGLLPQVKAFIDAGGKVFYQYEVSCCTLSSAGVAALLSGLTGLSIFPNANSYIASPINSPVLQGWLAYSTDTCVTFIGSAYKGLDGVPLNRQFIADSTLLGAAPPVSVCNNYGFFFTTTDFTGTAHNGAITGIGDYNIWYKGDEPFSNGGITPVDTSVIKYFFPHAEDKCYLFPPGCVLENTTGIESLNSLNNKINIFPNPVSSSFTLSGIADHSTIQISDLTGKIILNKIVNENEAIDLGNFAKGVYLLKTEKGIRMILKN